MNRTLLSLAILKVNWETNKKDYIENFVPLIGTLLLKNNYNEISLEKVQIDFNIEYGLKIPLNPLITIFNRMTKRQYINKNYGKYYSQPNKLLELDISINAKKVTLAYESLVNSLSQYCKSNYNISYELKDLEEAFISFLKDYDLEILFTSNDYSTLPEITSSKKFKYIISSFIINSYKNDSQTFSLISDISIGYALAQSILFPQLNSYSGKLTNLNFYFDTPFILNLIGLNGEHKQNSSIELVEILNREKVNMFVLQTNMDEIEWILNDCFKSLETGKFNLEKASKILRYCYKNDMNASDIEQFILRLKDLLKSYNIYFEKVPDSNYKMQYQIDENLLTDIIIETYTKNISDIDMQELESRRTIQRDVKVLSGLYKLREGEKPRKIKDAHHLFITTNTALAFASRVFEQSQNQGVFYIPVCLTDVFIGTIIWLQSPMSVEKLNQKKLIADCYSAMQPSEKLIKKYLIEVNRLKNEKKISSDDYYLLRSDRAALNLLEQFTLNDPELFDDLTTEEILSRIINRIKQEEKNKLEKERLEHEGSKIKIERLEIENEKLIEEKNILPAKLSNLVSYTIFILLLIVFISASSLSFFSTELHLNYIFVIGLWLIVLLFAFLNLYSGFSFRKTREETRKYFYEKFIKMK